MATLAIPCALRNLRIQQRKLTGRYGARLNQHPDGVALLERSTALPWASLFSCITPCTPQQGA
ncbi:hypothetical protein RY972_13510 [Aeromonas allosaccharophila]|uniref:Uncharacterized protein n=1 Tax=Aeromonas allosaccharophila TaxID=656 RepID=A0ABZ0F6U0_9GAMM|nr:hypothetical protein [Aeromonas allosaccharophila]WOE65086.1 hypothetical protein RY972_13510 [Aeromonas allosaccharophila]